MATPESNNQQETSRWTKIGPRIAALAMTGASIFAIHQTAHDITTASARETHAALTHESTQKQDLNPSPVPANSENLFLLGLELSLLGLSGAVLLSDRAQKDLYAAYDGVRNSMLLLSEDPVKALFGEQKGD
ncbi:MAG TPA: hypothetical protein VIH90_03755 [Candidatus Saccharimonadales bacterium]